MHWLGNSDQMEEGGKHAMAGCLFQMQAALTVFLCSSCSAYEYSVEMPVEE